MEFQKYFEARKASLEALEVFRNVTGRAFPRDSDVYFPGSPAAVAFANYEAKMKIVEDMVEDVK